VRLGRFSRKKAQNAQKSEQATNTSWLDFPFSAFALFASFCGHSISSEMIHPTIQWNDFERVELRVGTIVEVFDFPEARKPAWRLRVDFGPEIGIKQSSAQIAHHYDKAGLLGRQVVAVVNFAPKQIGPVRSEVLVTGFHDANGHVVLAMPERPVPNGTKLL
jgi:tRNA-binding protein